MSCRLFHSAARPGERGAGRQRTGERGLDIGISRLLNPPLHCSSILKFAAGVVPTPLRSLRLMVPTSTFIFLPLRMVQEGETTVIALALR
jgi:hypothetical protein